MRKIIWIFLFLISMVISIFFNFKSRLFTNFVKSSIMMSLVIFTAIIAIFFIKKLAAKNKIYWLLIPLIAVILYIMYLGVLHPDCMLPTPFHFATNTFTGKCEFIDVPGCYSKDYWYYKPLCNISKEEKLTLIKKSTYYNEMYTECMQKCNSQQLINCNQMVSPRTEFGTIRELPRLEVFCKDLV